MAGHWSWWRVMLPALAFLGRNAAYLLVGFLYLFWLRREEDEGEAARLQKHSRVGYTQSEIRGHPFSAKHPRPTWREPDL